MQPMIENHSKSPKVALFHIHLGPPTKSVKPTVLSRCHNSQRTNISQFHSPVISCTIASSE
jgi:hypothetical protein